MTGVRIRDDGFEGKCEYCHEYLPLTAEFWTMRKSYGVRRCRACVREYMRLKGQGYKVTRGDLWRANNRIRYRCLTFEEKERRRAINRAYKAAHREQIAAYNRAYKERKRAA